MRVRAAVASVVVLIGAVLGFGGGTASGAEERADVVQFRGRAVQAILTNCDPVAPLPCDAWDVFGGQERLRVNDRSRAAMTMWVAVYAITWDEDGPIITLVSEGFTDDAVVEVTPSGSSGTASGTVDLETCEIDPESDPEDPTFTCEPTGKDVTIELSLVATGKAERYRDSLREGESGLLFNSHIWGSRRTASATSAMVDGEPVVAVMPPYGDAPWLFTDAAAELCLGCGLEPPL